MTIEAGLGDENANWTIGHGVTLVEALKTYGRRHRMRSVRRFAPGASYRACTAATI